MAIDPPRLLPGEIVEVGTILYARAPLSGRLFKITRWHYDQHGRLVVDEKREVDETAGVGDDPQQ
jgi:hypothetical protein